MMSVRDRLERGPAGFSEVYEVTTTVKGYRKTKNGDGQEVTVEILDHFKMVRSIRLLPVFLRELKHFRAHTTQAGRMQYGGVGAHDDLIIAVGLALWYCSQMKKQPEPKPIHSLSIFQR